MILLQILICFLALLLGTVRMEETLHDSKAEALHHTSSTDQQKSSIISVDSGEKTRNTPGTQFNARNLRGAVVHDSDSIKGTTSHLTRNHGSGQLIAVNRDPVCEERGREKDPYHLLCCLQEMYRRQYAFCIKCTALAFVPESQFLLMSSSEGSKIHPLSSY